MKYKITCCWVLLTQHVVGKWRGVGEALQGWVEVTGVAHVLQACTNIEPPRPGELDPLWREEDSLRQPDVIAALELWRHTFSFIIALPASVYSPCLCQTKLCLRCSWGCVGDGWTESPQTLRTGQMTSIEMFGSFVVFACERMFCFQADAIVPFKRLKNRNARLYILSLKCLWCSTSKNAHWSKIKALWCHKCHKNNKMSQMSQKPGKYFGLFFFFLPWI